MQYIGASVGAHLRAPIEQVWALVSDVACHPELAGSGEVQAVRVAGGGPLAQGALFESQQCVRGINYVSASRVVAWDPPYRFAWRIGVPAAPGIGQIWQFELAREAAGTRVTNSVTLPFALPEFWPFGNLRHVIAHSYAAVSYPTLCNLARMLGVAAPETFETRLDPPFSVTPLLPSPQIQAFGWLAAGSLIGLFLLRRGRN